MSVPYFSRIIRSDDERSQVSRMQLARDWLGNFLGGIKEPIRRKLRQVSADVLHDAIEIACRRKLRGDYAEFGVFTGRSMIGAYHAFQEFGMNPRLFAFDSFEGLPALRGADQVRYMDYRAGAMSCTVDEFMRNCTRYGVPRDRLVPVPGWFSDTCTIETAARIGLKRIAVALLDCDILSSTLDALRFVGDHIEDGGMIVFDDWNNYQSHPQLGQRGAFATWVKERPDLLLTPIHDGSIGRAALSVHYRLSNEEVRASGLGSAGEKARRGEGPLEPISSAREPARSAH